MSDIDWAIAIDVIQNHTVKVATPLGSGTGFLVTYRQPSKFYGIATAYHVIEHAYEWQEPKLQCPYVDIKTPSTRCFFKR
jgi:hypothetical protein